MKSTSIVCHYRKMRQRRGRRSAFRLQSSDVDEFVCASIDIAGIHFDSTDYTVSSKRSFIVCAVCVCVHAYVDEEKCAFSEYRCTYVVLETPSPPRLPPTTCAQGKSLDDFYQKRFFWHFLLLLSLALLSSSTKNI